MYKIILDAALLAAIDFLEPVDFLKAGDRIVLDRGYPGASSER